MEQRNASKHTHEKLKMYTRKLKLIRVPLFLDGLEGVLTTLLRKLRKERGMSQRELGAYMGWSRGGQAVVSEFERLKHRENPTYLRLENHVLRSFAFALRYEGDPMDLLKEAD